MTTSLPHEGRIAWVTGGSSGIGEKTVELLKNDGASVGVLDLNPPTSGAPFVKCDISDAVDVKRATAELRAVTGSPDILVNCAGLGSNFPITELPDEIWRRDFGVNADGPFFMMRETMGHMIEQGWGRIVSVSTTTAVRPVAGRAAYGASKAALIALAKTAALEGAPHGVTSNLVAPGVTETPLTLKGFGSSEELRAKAAGSDIGNPMGTVNEPIDIAFAIRFLTLPEARHITGELIYVNGGAVMA